MIKLINLLIFLFIFFLSDCNAQEPNSVITNSPVPPEGYILIWADEFDIDGKPDSENWSYEQGFKRNDELQWYQSQNANIKDGILVIEGKREQVKNDNYDPESRDWRKNREFAEYTSSSINTRDKKQFQYGIVEVRAKIDPDWSNKFHIWKMEWTEDYIKLTWMENCLMK